ncbi:MAG: 3-dehydroquinate dehydratase [Saprospiraceae bacterium]|nr:3-dehydroquinate dehydratase [Saprospiraceae bacterium]MBK6566578.1 3-dehydroquinate dehydratase [Saprospiraceae bacterium]MBK7525571.1 3-dehydroquinate dehydratase [Saprospiraceae bacterium]MBK8081040.1 3-dehydroquinate dehydratase [Saprospiraceae bacterium]MBK8372679.1 3-dehydroquinate dehydratase [Saprospiraceae bacterium]
MTQIIIINGPNLNLLGVRQPEIYGTTRFEDYFDDLEKLFPEFNLHHFQSNHEGEIIDKLHQVGFRYEGIILNAGGFSHSSIAIADALRAITTPVIEVHISNIYEREPFRKVNYIKESSIHSIVGKGLDGYRQAIDYFKKEVFSKGIK